MALMKGYAKKPDSKIAGAVLKGFTDNPFLQAKHRAARRKGSELRHSGSPQGKVNNSDNSGVTAHGFGSSTPEEEQ